MEEIGKNNIFQGYYSAKKKGNVYNETEKGFDRRGKR